MCYHLFVRPAFLFMYIGVFFFQTDAQYLMLSDFLLTRMGQDAA